MIKLKTENLYPIKKYIIPSNKDYKNGYFYRYFSRQRNNVNATIYEIDEEQYNELKNSKLYKSIKVPWILVGELNEVMEINQNNILLKDNDLKGLKNLLYDESYKFWKEN